MKDEGNDTEYKANFQMADKNHDGRISFQELKEVMEKSQCSCSEAELPDYVNDEI